MHDIHLILSYAKGSPARVVTCSQETSTFLRHCFARPRTTLDVERRTAGSLRPTLVEVGFNRAAEKSCAGLR